MENGTKKLYISIAAGAIFFVAVIWLLMRACSQTGSADENMYHIGRDSTWYPLDLRGKETSMVGFVNDMMTAIGSNQGFKPHIFSAGPYGLFDGLDTKRYDAVLSSRTPNVINQQSYTFSDPFYLVGPVLIVQEDSTAKSLEDMTGKIIGIESGALQVFNIEELPNVVFIPYPTSAEALEQLDRNFIDGVILEALRAYVYTEGFYAGRLKVVSSPLTIKGLRLVARNDPRSIRFISRFNEGLKAIREDGVYGELIKKWGIIRTD